MRKAQYAKSIAFSEFPRLSEMLLVSDGAVDVWFSFYFDEKHKIVFDMQLKASMKVACVRCGDVVTVNSDISDTLQPLSGEDIVKGVKSDYDSCEMMNNSLNLLDIIEDTLLLSLPMKVAHDECGARASE